MGRRVVVGIEADRRRREGVGDRDRRALAGQAGVAGAVGASELDRRVAAVRVRAERALELRKRRREVRLEVALHLAVEERARPAVDEARRRAKVGMPHDVRRGVEAGDAEDRGLEALRHTRITRRRADHVGAALVHGEFHPERLLGRGGGAGGLDVAVACCDAGHAHSRAAEPRLNRRDRLCRRGETGPVLGGREEMPVARAAGCRDGSDGRVERGGSSVRCEIHTDGDALIRRCRPQRAGPGRPGRCAVREGGGGWRGAPRQARRSRHHDGRQADHADDSSPHRPAVPHVRPSRGALQVPASVAQPKKPANPERRIAGLAG